MFIEKHWPEGAVRCDRCPELIQAGWTIWFDDETGESLCESCYALIGENLC